MDFQGQISHQLTQTDDRGSMGSVQLANYNNNVNMNYNYGSGDIHNHIQTINNVFSAGMANEEEAMKARITALLRDRHVPQAFYNEQRISGCMDGTRVQVLRDIESWIMSPLTPVIFWIAGLAGTGKSSVAWTVCDCALADINILLGGSFFCSRLTKLVAQLDVRCIIPTLVQTLARQSPEFSRALADVLAQDPDVVHKQVKTQAEQLLYKPLSAVADLSTPILFVIDALDECSDERDLTELLEAIVELHGDGNLNVKFLLTSRPETHILTSPISNLHKSEILLLHMIKTAEVNQDIALYVENKFSQSSLAQPWYSANDVATLAALSDGLFIFASTIIAYVLNAKSVQGRKTRLRTAMEAVRQSAVAMGPLDTVYEFVITRASDTSRFEPEELKLTRKTLASILAAREPLSVNTLAKLLQLDADYLRESLQHLHAVVHVPDGDFQPDLRTLHASFGDYLFDRAARDVRIPESLGHDVLADGCLIRMSRDLYFNVSQTLSSYEKNSPTVSSRIALPLVYACLHWAHHIAAASNPSAFDTIIEEAFIQKFLFWLEVLSVSKNVSVASGLLRIAQSVLKLDLVSRFLGDANSFVASSHEPIERSAPHIYLSALPFAARDNLVYQIFAPLCAGTVSIETFGITRHGDQLAMTLTSHDRQVSCVAYSPDGRLLASGSDDGIVRIWDTRTGEEALISLQSGDATINSVAFAPDGKSIASGTDGGIYVWTGLTGQPTALRLSGHSDDVLSVAFSPDGSTLASGSKDMTIRLWKAESGLIVAVLRGHTGQINAIAFSPNSQILASCSSKHEIRLWKTRTGELVGQPHLRPGGRILSVGFSPDGTVLAKGCDDGTIVILECETWNTIKTLRGHAECVTSVQLSPDGRWLVSSSHDKTIRLWNLPQAAGESPCTVLSGHSSCVQSATFSPDGLYVASASDDSTIRIWDAGNSHKAVQPLPAHGNAVYSAVISADGSFIVSGSHDYTVRVWDIRSGEPKGSPLVGHTDVVLSVAISTDGYLIASASDDCTIRVWDARTGEAIGEPLQDHEGGVTAVTFAPDGCSLASGSWDRTVRIWDVKKVQPHSTNKIFCKHDVTATTFSPNGVLLAAGDSGRRIYLWNAASGQPVREPLQASSYVASVAFSHTGAQIVSAGFKTVCIWDTTSGQQVLSFHAHNSRVYSAKFSPDDRFICTSSADHAIYIWDVSTGAIADTLHGHGDAVRSATFTPDGQSIVSCSEDGTIRVWDVRKSCSLLSDHSENDLSGLVSTNFAETRGWVLSESGQLLLWVPEEYRAYLQAPPCTLIIRPRRVVVTAGPSGLHRGDDWTKCWRNHIPVPILDIVSRLR